MYIFFSRENKEKYPNSIEWEATGKNTTTTPTIYYCDDDVDHDAELVKKIN